jgi:hypothetical protein
MGEMINGYKILVEECEGKRLIGRCKLRSEDNIDVVIKETFCEDVDWINLDQDRVQWVYKIYLAKLLITGVLSREVFTKHGILTMF